MKILKVKDLDVLLDDEDYELLCHHPWSIRNDGYVVFYERNRRANSIIEHRIHRMVMHVEHQVHLTIDHINFNKLDNQKSNLRICTFSENIFHQPKFNYRSFTSKNKGVYWSKKRNCWIANITNRDRCIYLFASKNEDECAYAYNIAAEHLAPNFAILNPVSMDNPYIKNIVMMKLRKAKKVFNFRSWYANH